MVFIDESEATGAGILGSLEHNVAEVTRKRLYKYRGGLEHPEHLRIFGGLNVALFGDLWQLPPVSQVSIMANPFRERAIADHHARKMLAFFWQRDALNGFSENGLVEFSVCKWIDDAWYSKVIDECRAGALSDDAYNFLHGYPTQVSGSEKTCTTCSKNLVERMKDLRPGGKWREAPTGQVATSTDSSALEHARWKAIQAEWEAFRAEPFRDFLCMY